VPQEPFLFSGTIRSNIAYGRPEASDLEVERAAREVGAHEFIATLSQRAMGLVTSGRTTILIAHRLNTAQAAHRILVVDNGAIVEDGSHAELMALGGRYAALWAAVAAEPASM
jgi:ATP-binding cassette, subfamily B, bacterial